MDLVFDVQALQSPNTRDRGIDRYARHLVTALAAVRPGWNVELVQSTHWPAIDRAVLGDLPLHSFQPPLPRSAQNADANELYYADWLSARRPDWIVVPSFFDDQVLVPDFTGPRPPLAAVLHDLIPLLFSDEYLAAADDLALYGRRFRRLLAADAVITNSTATADDLQHLAPGLTARVVAAGGAAGDFFHPPATAERGSEGARLAERFGIRREFVLYVGGFDFRKNLTGCLEAFGQLPEPWCRQLDLVIACHLSEDQRREVEQRGRTLGLGDRLTLTGFVSDAELRALYRLCRLFFFPSLYEGLGFPVLEALACGAPVVASDCSSIPEYAGPVCWLADPRDRGSLVSALVEALEEPREVRYEARLEQAREFTWEKAATRAVRALEQRPAPGPARDRRRVAWVSPFPPANSGIADYSADLLGPLADHYDLELVIDPAEPWIDPGLANQFPVLLANEVRARHEVCPYDAFVFQIGNSHYHVYMLDLVRRFRSLVVVHDFFLGGLVLPAIQEGAWPATLAEELAYEGETELARLRQAGAVTDLEVIDRAPLNRRLLNATGTVAVHSRWARKRVQSLTSASVVQIPQAVPIPRLGSRAEERRRLGLALDEFVVASLGYVGPPKRIPSLLRAVAALTSEARACVRVLIVGFAPEEVRAELDSLANGLGIAPQVRLLGRVPFADFSAYARAADVCVQLRYPTRGETSAALLRELAAGATCVVSDHGSMGELADGAVLKVRTPDHEVEDLTAALTRLYQDPDLRNRLGEAAVRHVRAHHDLATVVEHYRALIELTASRRHADDTVWVERACDVIEQSGNGPAVASLLKFWPALRVQGRAGSMLPSQKSPKPAEKFAAPT